MNKLKLIENVLVDLSTTFSTSELQIIRGSLIKNLVDYDVTETQQKYALATIDEFNEALLKKFLIKKSLSGIAQGSIEQYMRETKRCLLAIDKRATDITPEDIEFYLMSYKAQRQITNTSMQNMVCYINNFFLFLEDEELIKKSPLKKLPKIKSDTIPEPIFSKKDEEKLFLSCSTLRDRAIIEFLLSTGCRVSEVCNLKLADIDFNTYAIRIIGKGHKLRTVYTNEKALLHLHRYLEERKEPSEYVFTTNRKPNRKLTPAGIEAMMKTVGEKAKVEKVHPHRFRATFCTRMIDRGVSLHVVQKLMGHTSIETTMRYYRGTGNLKNEYDKYVA
jgi:site-specific recombinase XerD